MSIAFPASLTRTYEAGAGSPPWVGLLSATLAYDTTNPRWGTGCLKVNTPGAATFEGVGSGTSSSENLAVSASTAYVLSVFVNAPSGSLLYLRCTERTADNAVGNGNIIADVNGTGAWERYVLAWTTAATTGLLRDFRVMTRSSAQAIEFRVDGWQLDQATTVQEYDGADAAPPATPQTLRPDADLATAGWGTAPLFSKLNDQSNATVISATCV